jgi:hypothetical protein
LYVAKYGCDKNYGAVCPDGKAVEAAALLSEGCPAACVKPDKEGEGEGGARTRRDAHAFPACIKNAEAQCKIARTRRESHSCVLTAIEMTKEQLKPKTTEEPGSTSVSKPKTTPPEEPVSGSGSESEIVSSTAAPTDTKPDQTVQVVIKYTVKGLEGDISKFVDGEEQNLKDKIKEQATKGLVAGSEAEVGEFTQDAATRRRAAHTLTFSAEVTVTFPVGTSEEVAKKAVKEQPKANLEYTINNEKKTHTIDFASLEIKSEKVKVTTTTPASSAVTVLSTVATVLIATVAALF